MKRIAMIGYTRLRYDSRVIRQALAAAEAGFAVDFYTLKEPSPKPPEGINVINSNFFQYKGSNKIAFICNYLRFFMFVTIQISKNHINNKYAVIHVNNMPNFLVFSCLLPKVMGAKIILDIHDLVPEVYAEKFNLSMDHILIKLLFIEERLSAWFSNVIISTNRLHNKRFKENKINKENIPIILNASDENIFTPYSKHDFYQEKITLIFPSTIAQRLGFDILIEAMSIVKSKQQNIMLKLYGDGEYKEELLELISKKNLQNQVEFVGLVDHPTLSREYEKAHIGVIPWPSNYSTNYQMPVKINEYFTKGLAVIASDVKILKEYFSDCALFFEAGDPQDFAEKIIFLVNHRDYMKQLAQNGHQFYKENSWSRYKSEYQEILKNLTR